MKILVVDDLEENRYLLRCLLEGDGHSCREAANGRDALALLGDGDWDLVVTDILMPVMDGYQLCRQIRVDPRLHSIPFVYYTATYTDRKDEEFALALGADLFLRKPMEPTAFLAAIRDLMGTIARDGGARGERGALGEEEILKLYNERLVRKLDKKIVDLEREMLQRRLTEEALRESEERYRTLVEQASDAIFILSPNAEILDVNPASCTIFGAAREELLGREFGGVVLPGDPGAVPVRTADIARRETTVFERRLARPDGSVVSVEIAAKALADGRVLGIARDVTERKKAEAALRESEERYALAAKGANDGLWDWDLPAGVMYFSARWKAMLGLSADEVGNSPEEWFSRTHPEDLPGLREEIRSHLDGVSPHFEREHRMLHRDGTTRWMLARGVAVRNASGEPVRMAGSQSDITHRKRAEEQMLHDAFHDRLTGLPNRALFLDRLAHACDRSRGSGDFRFAVLHVNVDRLRVINESLGHPVGDRVLGISAERIRECLRPGDTLARLSGDEFGILMEDAPDASDATRLAQRVAAALGGAILLEGQELFVSATLGIVTSGDPSHRPEEYLRDAHIAMRRAKTKRRGSYETFDPELHERAVEKLRLETALRRALEREEFEPYYQPVIDLASNRLVGFEALVRWNHPERGVLAPAAFLGVAEEADFLVAIDRRILRRACRQLRQWIEAAPSRGDLGMSVNFSSRQFAEPDVVDFVAAALAEHRLEPRHLAIEVTEGTLMENVRQTESVLARLRALGVALFVDDFGTGYSSLSYLHHFPLDMLKIDRSFVAEISSPEAPVPIVQTIVSLAESMAMRVLAEGVETPVQCSRVRDLGCHHVQGYYFSPPVDALEAETTLLTRRNWFRD